MAAIVTFFLQVKYYNAENYEVNRFEDAILKYQVIHSIDVKLGRVENIDMCKVTPECLLWLFR